MGDWYIKVDEKPVLRSINTDCEQKWQFRMGDLKMNVTVTPPEHFQYLNLDEYREGVQEEYKEMVLWIGSMTLPDRSKYFGGAISLDNILEKHPDPVGVYQRWKAKKDAAKEMTIEEIEAQLGYKIKVVGKETK